jgi:uncharacterized oxidoreductase
MDTIDFSEARVLITGGSDGIGLGLASRFLNAGSTVLITGRSHEKLELAAETFPGLITFANDIGVVAERERLANHVRETLQGVNVVINNAGIQRRVSLADDHAPWAERQAEIDIILSAPVHLNHLLIPTILQHGRPSLIANVTSGGAYIPQPFAPLYSACKAALHSYTVNLRFSLAGTPCKVIEIIPPAVRTALAGPNATHGVSLDDFCNTIFADLNAGECDEMGYGMTASAAVEERLSAEREMFAGFSERFPVRTYDSSKK